MNSLFEAGIDNTISSAKLQKTKPIFFKYTSSKLSYFTNWASTTDYIIHFSDILIDLKYV